MISAGVRAIAGASALAGTGSAFAGTGSVLTDASSVLAGAGSAGRGRGTVATTVLVASGGESEALNSGAGCGPVCRNNAFTRIASDPMTPTVKAIASRAPQP